MAPEARVTRSYKAQNFFKRAKAFFNANKIELDTAECRKLLLLPSLSGYLRIKTCCLMASNAPGPKRAATLLAIAESLYTTARSGSETRGLYRGKALSELRGALDEVRRAQRQETDDNLTGGEIEDWQLAPPTDSSVFLSKAVYELLGRPITMVQDPVSEEVRQQKNKERMVEREAKVQRKKERARKRGAKLQNAERKMENLMAGLAIDAGIKKRKQEENRKRNLRKQQKRREAKMMEQMASLGLDETGATSAPQKHGEAGQQEINGAQVQHLVSKSSSEHMYVDNSGSAGNTQMP